MCNTFFASQHVTHVDIGISGGKIHPWKLNIRFHIAIIFRDCVAHNVCVILDILALGNTTFKLTWCDESRMMTMLLGFASVPALRSRSFVFRFFRAWGWPKNGCMSHPKSLAPLRRHSVTCKMCTPKASVLLRANITCTQYETYVVLGMCLNKNGMNNFHLVWGFVLYHPCTIEYQVSYSNHHKKNSLGVMKIQNDDHASWVCILFQILDIQATQ